MTKNEKHQHTPKKKAPDLKKQSSDIFERLNSWFEKHDKKIFFILLFSSTLFSLLLFDSKVSEGGDDSSYIQRAWSLLNEGIFPYYQGPAYPIFLSFIVKLFGLNIIALKFFSVFCQIGFVLFTYLTFRKRIPYIVLFALIAFLSFNHFIQYYASQTFTETFFLFVQSICLYVVFNIIDTINKDSGWLDGFKQNYLKWILFGVFFVLLSISKSIAFVTIIGIVIYFVLNKNYKQVVYALIAFFLIRIFYQLLVSSIFGPNDSDQLEMVLRKELYKPEAGHENLSGMIERFFNNFNTYISLHMYRILNFRSIDTLLIIPPLSYISTIIFGIFTFISYKRNKYVFFSSIYMIVLCTGIFIGIQAANMQDRLIIIVMPLIFIVLFYGTYELVKRSAGAQFIFILFAGIMCLVTISKSVAQAKENTKALKKNLSGDIYYGYTPDWENFLKMGKYCADSLPDSAQVLSRKPNMSFIYGNGKKFVGQYWVTTMNADSVLMAWEQQKVKYVILANLRMNPKKNNGRIINTIHRMLQPVAQKYPQKLKVVKVIGEVEPTYLYEISY
ncbi:MAG: glycosyltransferase family 39 protein [Bacteroidetes bacterium]|nr:glycosyltransferase family 39 protein [Bacteroidota bacterium]